MDKHEIFLSRLHNPCYNFSLRLFHSTLLNCGRAARGPSLFKKRRNFRSERQRRQGHRRGTGGDRRGKEAERSARERQDAGPREDWDLEEVQFMKGRNLSESQDGPSC